MTPRLLALCALAALCLSVPAGAQSGKPTPATKENKENKAAATQVAPAATAPTAAGQNAPAPNPTATAPSAPTNSAAVNNAVLKDTKPDLPSGAATASPARSISSPMATVGDGGRMLLYLIPTLLLMVAGLHLLRKYQERTGRMPRAVQYYATRFGENGGRRPAGGGWVSALLGGMNLSKARTRGGTNIRLIEAVPVGGANLHLIEVRGRQLLLAVSGAGVTLLTDFREETRQEESDFQALLNATAADMDSLDLGGEEFPTTAVVGALDAEMKDTNALLATSLQRLRRVQEREDA